MSNSPPVETQVGRVVGIAVRSATGGPMREEAQVQAVENAGLAGDVPSSLERGVTLISAGQWRDVMSELRANLPWHTRRANLLIDCAGLGHLIGQRVRVGGVELRIVGETRPCQMMDAQLPGLREALKRDCRGGVHGQVLAGGTIRIGDELVLPAE